MHNLAVSTINSSWSTNFICRIFLKTNLKWMLWWFFICSIPFHLNCIPFLGVWLFPVYRRVIWFFAVCCRVVPFLSVHCKIKSICLLQLQTDKPIISLPVFLGLSSAILVRVIRITTASRSTAAADPIPAAMAAIKKVQRCQMQVQIYTHLILLLMGDKYAQVVYTE